MKEGLTDSDFSIGRAEAWETQERENLRYNFLPIRQFSYISEPERTFLCGRRGSGKSAIAIMLELNSPNAYTEAVQGEIEEYGTYMDIVRKLGKKRESDDIDVDIKHAVRRLWLWVLPVKAMQIVIKRSLEQGASLDSNLADIKEYLSSLPEPLHENSKIGALLSNTFESAFKLLEKKQIAEFDSYLVNLTGSQKFHSAIIALGRIIKSKPILIILDTLESYRVFQPYMVEGLQGVLEAILAFLSDRRIEGILLKFFIPAEIYDKVFTGFPGKIQPKTVFLRWRSADLISMLARRYLAILIRTEADIPKQDVERLDKAIERAYKMQDGRHLRKEFWYETKFLPDKIVNRMGFAEDTFAYMFRHTHLRPRDSMVQMQHIINEAREREEFPYISPDSIIAGVHNTTVLQQILGDALIPYEGSLPMELITGARTVFYQRPMIMNGREMKKFAQELYSMYPLPGTDPAVFINLLFYCGVVGKVNTEKANDKYCIGEFEYMIQGNLPVSDRFLYCIHPVMADMFHMSPVEGYGAVYPIPDQDLWLEKEIGITS